MRESAAVLLRPEQLRLTDYLHRHFGLNSPSQTAVLSYPLKTLSVGDLLTLLFFVAAQLAEMPDYTGIGVSRYKNNTDIHEYLCQAIAVFDDWAANYHRFIKQWQKQDKRSFINYKQLALSKAELPREHSEYELFNQMLHYIFYEEQFSFMHEEFKIFLEKLSFADSLH